jgi:hypothetical protein
MKKRGKKSQGNIELVLSFVIFVGFILVMLVFLNPMKNSATSYSSLDNIHNKIMNNISLEFDSLAIRINSGIYGDCFQINLNGAGALGKVMALSSNNFILKANKNNEEIIFEKTSDYFYIFYFSDSFNESPEILSKCVILNSKNYSLGLLNQEKRVLIENLENLNNSYSSDYSGLKNSIGIREDFDFSVFNSTSMIFDTSNIHKMKTGNVVSRDIPIKAINKNAEDIDIILRIRTW